MYISSVTCWGVVHVMCSRCGVRSVRCRGVEDLWTTQSGLESISINLSAQKEDEAHEKQTMQYIYPHCINMFAFDYLFGISRVICLGCVDEYLLQKSFRNTFSQKRVAYDCDSSTKIKKKRESDAEKQVSSVLQSSLIRREICCVFSVCVWMNALLVFIYLNCVFKTRCSCVH